MEATEGRWMKEALNRDLSRLHSLLCEAQDVTSAFRAWVGNAERRALIADALAQVSWRGLIVDAGVTPARSIGDQIRAKIGEALLPALVPRDDIRSWLDPLFSDSCAIERTEHLDPHEVAEVLSIVGLSADDLAPELEVAARMLALRVSAAATQGVIADRSVALGLCTDAFLSLAPNVAALLDLDSRDIAWSDVAANIATCRSVIHELRDDHRIGGTSLEMTTGTRRILEQLRLLEALLEIACELAPDERHRKLGELIRDVIVAHYSHVTLGQVVSDSADLVAFQVTEQAASRSDKYVGKNSYWKLLRAGLLGGALVAVFACFKLLLATLALPLGVQALVYGINYSLCFVLIYAIGATLATKQPAFTAAAIASAIDDAKNRTDGLHRVARQVVTVWRNQFVSLIGNVACALPLAAGVAIGYAHLSGTPLADPTKATYLIDSNAPWRSLALYYAAIAGFFLFLSGLIQGAIQNRVAFGQVGERIRRHPRLRFLGARREWIADRLTPHLGAIAGNVSLGFLLGSAGTLGAIFGLPIDIRHVAFSSAHVGVAFTSGLGMTVTAMLIVVAGVLLTGLVNFALSFGLTLWVSLKSRRTSFGQWRALAGILCRQFADRPLAWFLPVPPADHSTDHRSAACTPSSHSA